MKDHTLRKPKCMSLYKNKPFLFYQIDNFHKNKINKLAIVTGYKSKEIKAKKMTKFHNKNWLRSNILYSLFCADKWLKKFTCIISYSDILYNFSAIDILKKTDGDVVILYDPNWLKLWKKRFKKPLSDAENFNFDNKNFLTSIGGKPKKIKGIQGQYMGVFKINPRGWNKIKKHVYLKLDKKLKYLDITNFFKSFISNKNNKVKVVKYRGSWYEVDTKSDYNILLKSKI